MINYCLIISAAIIPGYLWIENTSSIMDHVKKISGILSNKHKKILKRNFPFYSKLSSSLLVHFEQKVEYYFYKKLFEDNLGNKVDDKKKLLISAYAAQITFGLKDFYYLKLKKIVVYEDRFFSDKFQKRTSWEILENGTILIAWKIFYSELRSNRSSHPIGLMVMANALKKEKFTFLREQIYYKNASTYFSNSKTGRFNDYSMFFGNNDVKNHEDFFINFLT